MLGLVSLECGIQCVIEYWLERVTDFIAAYFEWVNDLHTSTKCVQSIVTSLVLIKPSKPFVIQDWPKSNNVLQSIFHEKMTSWYKFNVETTIFFVKVMNQNITFSTKKISTAEEKGSSAWVVISWKILFRMKLNRCHHFSMFGFKFTGWNKKKYDVNVWKEKFTKKESRLPPPLKTLLGGQIYWAWQLSKLTGPKWYGKL